MTSILFVCLGNICRSPTAEAVLREHSTEKGLALTIDSAGTANYHQGSEPYGPMQAAAGLRGYSMSDLKARQVRARDFTDFDLIVAMDAQNLRDLRAVQPEGTSAKLALFSDFAKDIETTDVPDPYYTRDFDGALDLIEICSDGLIHALER